jgi:hypothetical protein
MSRAVMRTFELGETIAKRYLMHERSKDQRSCLLQGSRGLMARCSALNRSADRDR